MLQHAHNHPVYKCQESVYSQSIWLVEWTLASGGNFIRKNLRSDSNIQVAAYLFISAPLSCIHITQSVE